MNMLIINIAAVVIAVTLVVLAAFLIPAIIELRKTAIATRDFLAMTEMELHPALKELRQLLMELKDMADSAAGGMDDVKVFMSSLGEAGRNIHSVNSIIGNVAGFFNKSGFWMTTALTAGKFMFDRLKKKRRQSHGE